MTITQHEYETFQRAFDFLNVRLFDGKLPPILITMARKRRVAGYFRNDSFQSRGGEDNCTTHEIAMNPDCFDGKTDAQIWSTMAHEMCHLWQQEYGKHKPKGGYHNHEWATKMMEIGLVPSSTGDKYGQIVGHKMSHYIEDRGLFESAAIDMLDMGIRPSWQSPRPQESTSTATRESKFKFLCRECGMNAWAKSTAKLKCGQCDKEMEAAR